MASSSMIPIRIVIQTIAVNRNLTIVVMRMMIRMINILLTTMTLVGTISLMHMTKSTILIQVTHKTLMMTTVMRMILMMILI